MTAQPTLPGVEPPVTLTDRQQRALTIITERAPIRDLDLGMEMHAVRGKHARDVFCSYCGHEGRGVAYELERKGLVDRLRVGWAPSGWSPGLVPSSQMGSDDEWPF